MKSLENCIIWITGANRGIGAACAKHLVRTGAHVVLSARKVGTLDSLAASFAAEARYSVVPCDVSQSASIDAAYKEIVFKTGAPDILINNAGVGIFAPFTELSPADIDAMLTTNLRGAMLCTQAVLPAMKENGGGVIVNINSVAAVKTFTNSGVYAASKAGLLAMSRVVREEVRESGIKVIDLIIGATETDIWAAEARTAFSSRMMQPNDVAEALLAALRLPLRMMPEELVLRPQLGDL